ncbi:hypothetical protein EMIHUDRAFT_225855 [Emiliania huxleyi CCMP1516]|uniref:Uncharacterized protein n=2 Tax=Emiliania huxleyi TaxID=2903 RepID=A0A0D3KN20_EMIH1|nr:hypothetical protein EMIHUDRAFT_225855 [Emiliania huxleyi CCMP1516]EOD37155.1 hypothetical protein EMIHUDRAFT_225855 [Emiliania huxleyi CCMP1516]|eukprot:XP_005789584.1 hypothetical protein EMIHUDRAFT_225855 [Emiliania huxleyi CCMP1516]
MLHRCADNYNSFADVDDGSCAFEVYGCVFSQALNYNSEATVYDGSCVFAVLGCQNSSASNYRPDANTDDPQNPCVFLVEGCVDTAALNFDSEAQILDDSCVYPVPGCLNATAVNFNSAANEDDGSCVEARPGCEDPAADNYDPLANEPNPDAPCEYTVEGCTNSSAVNYNSLATVPDDSCVPEIPGCMASLALNYRSSANRDDGSCDFPTFGCTNSSALNYLADATADDGSCIFRVPGCTRPGALNFDSEATVDDGSCVDAVLGCTDAAALNYRPLANRDDDSCLYFGCPNPRADNYDDRTNANNQSVVVDTNGTACDFPTFGCTNSNAANYMPNATSDDGSCFRFACAQSDAPNYDDTCGAAAGLPCLDDGSCRPKIAALEDLYTEAAEALNTQPFLNDIIGNSFARGCADNNADFFDMFGLGSGGGGRRALQATAGSPAQAAAGRESEAAGTGVASLDEVLSPLRARARLGAPGKQREIATRRRFAEEPVPRPEISTGCTDSLASNFDSEAVAFSGRCWYDVIGCMNSTALNYNPIANVEGSCVPRVSGCMASSAVNFDDTATTMEGAACTWAIRGCTDPAALTFDPLATEPDPALCTAPVVGCADPLATSYSAAVNLHNSTACIYPVRGCTDSASQNYDPAAEENDGSCVRPGCAFPSAANFAPGTTVSEPDECVWLPHGCSEEPRAANYDPDAQGGGVCFVPGCRDPSAPDFDSSATFDAGCKQVARGCTDAAASNYAPRAEKDDGSCRYGGCKTPTDLAYSAGAHFHDESACRGRGNCTDSGAANFGAAGQACRFGGCTNMSDPAYSPDATFDDGTCGLSLRGCTSSSSANFDAAAAVSGGGACVPVFCGERHRRVEAAGQGVACVPHVFGCTDERAANFAAWATADDRSAVNYNSNATQGGAQDCEWPRGGCTDSASPTYRSWATVNDGSCYVADSDTPAGVEALVMLLTLSVTVLLQFLAVRFPSLRRPRLGAVALPPLAALEMAAHALSVRRLLYEAVRPALVGAEDEGGVGASSAASGVWAEWGGAIAAALEQQAGEAFSLRAAAADPASCALLMASSLALALLLAAPAALVAGCHCASQLAVQGLYRASLPRDAPPTPLILQASLALAAAALLLRFVRPALLLLSHERSGRSWRSSFGLAV